MILNLTSYFTGQSHQYNNLVLLFSNNIIEFLVCSREFENGIIVRNIWQNLEHIKDVETLGHK